MGVTKVVLLLLAGFTAALGLVLFAFDWPLPTSMGAASLLLAAAWPWRRR